jgi:uncharacterized membrane protein YcaP (DUF421 family)
MHFKFWHDMFFLGLPVIEKILRPVIVYFFLVIALRLAGKRELVQLNPFDLVVLLTLANTVQNSIIGDDNSVTGGLISAATLLIVNFFVVRFLYNHEKLDRWVEGNPDTIIENGKVRLDRLRKELITLSQLESAAHKQGFTSLEEIETAVLEPGGTLAMIGKKPGREDKHHQELLLRLDKIFQEIDRLKQKTS